LADQSRTSGYYHGTLGLIIPGWECVPGQADCRDPWPDPEDDPEYVDPGDPPADPTDPPAPPPDPPPPDPPAPDPPEEHPDDSLDISQLMKVPGGIGVGLDHAVVLVSSGSRSGTAKTCGQPAYLGRGEDAASLWPSRPWKTNVDTAGVGPFLAVAAGPAAVYLVDGYGDAYAFGSNSSGELGIPDLAHAYVPRKIQGLKDVVSVSASYRVAAFLDVRGDVHVCGSMYRSPGAYSSPVRIPGLERIVKISASPAGIMALDRYGNASTAYVNDSNRRLTVIPLASAFGAVRIRDISAGARHWAVVYDNGWLRTGGSNLYGATGRYGRLYQDDYLGSRERLWSGAGDVSGFDEATRPVRSVTCGAYCTFIVTRSGDLFTCGYSDNFQLGRPDAAEAPFFEGDAIELGMPVHWEAYGTNLGKVEGLPPVHRVFACNWHPGGPVYLLMRDGSVWSYGRRYPSGALGRDLDYSLAEGYTEYTPYVRMCRAKTDIYQNWIEYPLDFEPPSELVCADVYQEEKGLVFENYYPASLCTGLNVYIDPGELA
jgi:hypothetical protein